MSTNETRDTAGPTIAAAIARMIGWNLLAFIVLAAVMAYAGHTVATAQDHLEQEWRELQDLSELATAAGESLAMAQRERDQGARKLSTTAETRILQSIHVAQRLRDLVEDEEDESEHGKEERELTSELVSLLEAFPDRLHGLFTAPSGDQGETRLLAMHERIGVIVESFRDEDTELVGDTLEGLSALRHQVEIAFAGVVVVLFAFLALSGISLWRTVSGQLAGLRRGAQRVSSGAFDERLDGGRYLEFRELADSFNSMASRLADLYGGLEDEIARRTEELASAQRLAAIGELAAGVAHEIGTPLGSITGCAEGLQARLRDDTLDPETLADYLQVIRDAAYRMKRVSGGLLELGRRTEPGIETIDLVEVAKRAIEMARHAHAIEVEVVLRHDPPPLQIDGDAVQLAQVITNLIVNALESHPRAQIEVEIGAHSGEIRLEVADDGDGIEPGVLPRIFEPFFSTRIEGTGIGLAVTRDIVRAHRGTIAAASEGPGLGSRFSVSLPCSHVLDQRAGDRRNTL